MNVTSTPEEWSAPELAESRAMFEGFGETVFEIRLHGPDVAFPFACIAGDACPLHKKNAAVSRFHQAVFSVPGMELMRIEAFAP